MNINTNMSNAHAEVVAMQNAFEAGCTQGEEMVLRSKGAPMCSYCKVHVPIMAEAIGLERLEVFAPDGSSLVWVKGAKGFKRSKGV